MKSPNQSRTKLTLHKTTLRTLAAVELQDVAGASDILHTIGRLCVRMTASQQPPCDV